MVTAWGLGDPTTPTTNMLVFVGWFFKNHFTPHETTALAVPALLIPPNLRAASLP